MYQQKEEDLKILQELIPGATVENLQAFQHCMRTDAVYKSGLPYGITSAVLSHLILPKKLGTLKSVVTAFTGFTSFMFGKIIYSPTCKEKVFGPISPEPARLHERRPLDSTSNYVDNIDEQEQQGKLVLSSDKLLEEDSSWSNIDTYSDNNLSQFDDTVHNFQDELTIDQPVDVKKRVTYDDLWAQHKENRMKVQYKDFKGSRPVNRENQVPPQQVSEQSSPVEPFDERNFWR